MQTKLAPGSWDVDNYHGGYPFPNPAEPNKAYKILYNSWFSYRPAVVNERSFSLAIDKYKNQTTSSYNIVINQLNFNVDPGVPETNPVMPDYLNATYIELQSPEQSRYITSLDLKHKDPAEFPDLYTFIPALRRVLRLSAAAVCADIQGSDVDNDDACPNIGVCPQIPIFKVDLLGERKFLANMGMSHDSVSPPDGKFVGYNPLYWHDTAADLELTNGIVIPKREAGKWEVRDVYVLRWQRLPEFQAGYCFGSRISYIDKQNFNSLGVDNFDMQQKFYKAAVGDYQILESPAGGPYFSADANLSYTIDFQNFHASNGGEFYAEVQQRCRQVSGHFTVRHSGGPATGYAIEESSMTPGYECHVPGVEIRRQCAVIWPLALLRQIKDHYRLFETKSGTKYCVRTETLNKHRFNRILLASVRFS